MIVDYKKETNYSRERFRKKLQYRNNQSAKSISFINQNLDKKENLPYTNLLSRLNKPESFKTIFNRNWVLRANVIKDLIRISKQEIKSAETQKLLQENQSRIKFMSIQEFNKTLRYQGD